MKTIEAIYARRAVREYSDAPVKRETVELLIAAAIQAPSAMNTQPWHFTVIRNQPLLDRISTSAKAYMLHLLGSNVSSPGIRQHLTDPDAQIFHHAPVVVLISAKAGDWAVEDASLAAENFMLAASEQGLGTCWIGFAQRWLETQEGKDAIGLPSDYQPIAPIIVGHPRGPAPPVPRKPPIIDWID